MPLTRTGLAKLCTDLQPGDRVFRPDVGAFGRNNLGAYFKQTFGYTAGASNNHLVLVKAMFSVGTEDEFYGESTMSTEPSTRWRRGASAICGHIRRAAWTYTSASSRSTASRRKSGHPVRNFACMQSIHSIMIVVIMTCSSVHTGSEVLKTVVEDDGLRCQYVPLSKFKSEL